MTDKDRYQEMVKSVEGRFSEEWKIEENHILLDHTVMIMHYPKDFTTIPEFSESEVTCCPLLPAMWGKSL